jgi:hypothetical protein
VAPENPSDFWKAWAPVTVSAPILIGPFAAVLDGEEDGTAGRLLLRAAVADGSVDGVKPELRLDAALGRGLDAELSPIGPGLRDSPESELEELV